MDTLHHDEHKHCGPVHFIINREHKESLDRTLTGRQLKLLAGVPDTDELFLETHCGDEGVPNDATLLVRDGDRFHTMPSPQYGYIGRTRDEQVSDVLAVYRGETRASSSEGTLLLLHDVKVPGGYSAPAATILIKVPAAFPNASPDMFWVAPALSLANGSAPRSTSMEVIDGQPWQRFSWHLQPNSWHPGLSTLRDFVRAVMMRLQKVG